MTELYSSRTNDTWRTVATIGRMDDALELQRTQTFEHKDCTPD